MPGEEDAAVTSMSSREFNQDTGRAKRAARRGPVYVTDRGHVSHVLLSFEDYERLAGKQRSIVDLLAEPAGIEDVDFEAPTLPDVAQAASFD
jgi:Antitoxin Phd_YefM, type II toxin-antitoxin system